MLSSYQNIVNYLTAYSAISQYHKQTSEKLFRDKTFLILTDAFQNIDINLQQTNKGALSVVTHKTLNTVEGKS